MIRQLLCNYVTGGTTVAKTTKQKEALKKELEDLKAELFKGQMFVILPDGPKTERYAQLLGFFYPHLRPKGWKDPLKEAV